jgi:hypothetical protein
MCDGYSNVPVDIGHKIVDVDECIAPLVKALNDGGYRTLASCCGHGKQPGTIPLVDPDGNERWVILTKDRVEAERLMGWNRPPTGTPDTDVHVERCESSECPCYRAGADLAAQFVATLRDDAADPAPTGTPDTGDDT